MAWPEGRVKTSVQPLIGALPALVILMDAVKPVFQLFIVYETCGRVPPGGTGVVVAGSLGGVPPLRVVTNVITLRAGRLTVREPFDIRRALCGDTVRLASVSQFETLPDELSPARV